MQFSPALARRVWQSFLDKLFVRHRCRRRQPILRGFLPRLEALEDRVLLNSYPVTTTADSGAGTLRQALLDANSHVGQDSIVFQIQGAGLHTIRPASALPAITDAVLLDGTTQLGYVGTPIIEIDGSQAGDGTNGLYISAGHSTVQGLIINRFSGSGIILQQGDGNIIQGNYLGTDPSGGTAQPNGVDGIEILTSNNNTVGGTTAAARNLISGNTRVGILFYSNASHNVVQGNYIGTDAAGMAAVGNAQGVDLQGGSHNNIIGGTTAAARNIISGCSGNVMLISDPGTTGNNVQGNYLGTNAHGTAILGNAFGVAIYNGATDNTVGGTTSETGNVIAGTTDYALLISGSGTTDNRVQGNLFGTDATGTVVLAAGPGIILFDQASRNTIGGTGVGAGNVIAGTVSYGLWLTGSGTTENVVQGNFFGTDRSATLALGNSGPALLLTNGANNNTIGGIGSGAGNVIANTATIGIVVTDTTTTGNSIRGNSIHDNQGIGIDLGWDGITINDNGDADSGPNDLQNYPVIKTATPGATATVVSGTLSSASNAMVTLDFYASPTHDITFFGQGQRYLGSTTVTTDAAGIAAFVATLPAATSTGEWLTATATDAAGNTSEFSAAVQLPYSPSLNSSTWTPIGPAPLIAPFGVLAGRVDVAAPDPTDVNVMYIGSDQGGIWKTTNWLDPSPVWVPLTDFQPSLDLNEHGLVVSPSNPQIVYGLVQGPGGGLLKTDNGSASWIFLSASFFDQNTTGAIVVSPADSNLLYVAVSYGGDAGGVYESIDGGQNWTNTTASTTSGNATDVLMDPTNPAILYAGLVNTPSGAGNGIYKTINGGASWSRLTTGLPAGASSGDTLLALCASSPQNVVAAITDPLTNLPVRYRTTNGGSSWSSLAALPTPDGGYTGHRVLAVDPANPLIIYTSGDHTNYKSSDGGTTWTALQAYDPVGAYFDRLGGLVIADDSGIYRYDGTGTAFASKQGNLENNEFYTLTLDPTNADNVYGIAQDHVRALRYSGAAAWNYLTAGDEAGKVLVNPVNPNRLFVIEGRNSTTFVRRSDDGGASWVDKGTGIPTTDSGLALLFATQRAFQIDPGDPHHLVAGTTQVYETTNDADSWTAISPVLSPGQFITNLDIAPSASGTIYAATQDGRFFVTTNGGTDWLERDATLPGVFYNRVSDLRIDPANSQRVFLVTNGYGGSDHIWMTTDGGVHWSNITNNVPAQYSVNTIAVDWRYATPILYVGTARGVYRSLNLGTAWAPFGAALPNTIVNDLQLSPQLSILAAATYGRGVFEIVVRGPADLNQSAVSVTPANIQSGSMAAVTLTARDAAGNQEATGGLTVAFLLGNGDATGTFSLVTDNGDGTYTATFTGGMAGTNTITATINGVPVTSTPASITVDNTPPTAGTVNDGAGADIDFQASTTTISANWTGFSDSGSGLATYQWAIGTSAGAADVQTFTSVGIATSASASGLSLSNGTKYFVSVQAIDKAGNVSTQASSNGVTVDNTSPMVTIGAPSQPFANSVATVSFSLTFSDANFDPSSTSVAIIKSHLMYSTSAGVTVLPANVNVTGSGTRYTVNITGVTGNGTAGISVTAGVAADKAGNQTAGRGPSTTFIVDNIKPAVTIGAPATSFVAGALVITYTITYSDANFDRSTLVVGDITLNNRPGTANATVKVGGGTGAIRTVTLTNITGTGSLGISLAAGTAVDKAGNLAGPAVSVRPPTFSSANHASFTAGSPISFQLAATGVPSTITFSVSGAPAWLSINASNKIIGTPPVNSSNTLYPVVFTIIARNGVGPFASQTFTLTVNPKMTFSLASLPAYTAGTPYAQTITTAGGTGPRKVTYTVSGPIPAGIKISASGTSNFITISGTPMATTSITITLTVTDEVGAFTTKIYTLAVNYDPRRRNS